MPRYKSRRYKNSEGSIINSGIRVTVEEFDVVKTLLFILLFVFFIIVQTKNTHLAREIMAVGKPGINKLLGILKRITTEDLAQVEQLANHAECVLALDSRLHVTRLIPVDF